jgi:hypothetical protein
MITISSHFSIFTKTQRAVRMKMVKNATQVRTSGLARITHTCAYGTHQCNTTIPVQNSVWIKKNLVFIRHVFWSREHSLCADVKLPLINEKHLMRKRKDTNNNPTENIWPEYRFSSFPYNFVTCSTSCNSSEKGHSYHQQKRNELYIKQTAEYFSRLLER